MGEIVCPTCGAKLKIKDGVRRIVQSCGRSRHILCAPPPGMVTSAPHTVSEYVAPVEETITEVPEEPVKPVPSIMSMASRRGVRRKNA